MACRLLTCARMSVEEQRRRETSAIHAAVKISTDASLENEFSDQRNMLSRAFPWVFPLGAAASFPTVTGTLSDAGLGFRVDGGISRCLWFLLVLFGRWQSRG